MSLSPQIVPLSDYLRLIRWATPDDPIPLSLASLLSLQKHHYLNIPFDNFEFHVASLPVRTDPEYVWERVKGGKRGTYCFQGNGLFKQMLRQIGFQSFLIPCSPWRPFLGDFSPLPTHCMVLVILGDAWYIMDVASIDPIKGVLALSDPLLTPHATLTARRYRFVRWANMEYELSDEDRDAIDRAEGRGDQSAEGDCLDAGESRDGLLLYRDHVTIVMQKEDVKRDAQMNPLEPPNNIEWISRFMFRLPLKENVSANLLPPTYHPGDVSYPDFPPITSFVSIPSSVSSSVTAILADRTSKMDPRSYHFKQWLGLRFYEGGLKKILTGFRYIEVSDNTGERRVTRLGGNLANTGVEESDEIISASFQKVRDVLEKEIGIILDDDFVSGVNVKWNYISPKIEHVWAF